MKTKYYIAILISMFFLPIEAIAFQKKSNSEMQSKPTKKKNQKTETSIPSEPPICSNPGPKWYLELQPGYYYFTDHLMREFFDDGGFTGRAELGYKIWKPFYAWLDGGYFQKKGHAIGGPESTHIKLATITLGLKTIFFCSDWLAYYLGAGPRGFMLMMHNDSPYVSDENGIGIGGGFDSGFWILPFSNKNLFFNLFVDYSWKNLKIEEDETSSTDHDIDVSGITAGAGIGFRF